ncbi:MAG: hypothetical protein Kilf2KO_01970 [Rhodospirillales bacterium]
MGTFSYIESAAFDGNGNSRARFDAGQGQVEVDSDGDDTLDIAFRMQGLSEAGQLTASDFVWA